MPFLTLLAVTGLGMLLFANITGKEGERIHVVPQATVQPLSVQAEAARSAVNPKLRPSFSIMRRVPMIWLPCSVSTMRARQRWSRSILYTAKVVNTMPRNQGWYHTMDEIHSDMMLGLTGDYLLETAASLTIIMIISGLYFGR